MSADIETIVRVLSHQGHINAADDDIQPHLREIQQRYSELKMTTDFMTSAQIARVEWLERFMSRAEGFDAAGGKA